MAHKDEPATGALNDLHAELLARHPRVKTASRHMSDMEDAAIDNAAATASRAEGFFNRPGSVLDPKSRARLVERAKTGAAVAPRL